MFDDKKLWKDRFGTRIKDLGRYLRYIFNGHLVIVLVFLIGSAAFYYQKWVASLPSGFPAEIIMALLLGISLTYSPIYNLLVEADKVFLLPLEDKLKGYFLRSGVASFVLQAYILLLILAVLMPMYAHTHQNGYKVFLPYLFILFVIKAWNIVVHWHIGYFVQVSVHRWDMMVRYLMNAVFTYLLLKQANIYFLVIILLIMVFYYRFFFMRTKKMGLKWDLLIEQEEKRMASFYRLANLFTDVPKLRETVKRRKWLDVLTKGISHTRENTYLYLYSRTFLRSSDYLGLTLRLMVIGILAIYFISFGLGQILPCVLFLYLTGFQLLPLWNHHQNKLWADLYPVEQKYRVKSFHSLLLFILTSQAIIISLFILVKGQLVIALLSILAGVIFNLLFVLFYSKNRIKA